MTTRIGTIYGSHHPESIHRKLGAILAETAPESVELVTIEIDHLPLYDRSYDNAFPTSATQWQRTLGEFDALLFVSPEHNRSIPAVVSNAISWASRPQGTNALAGKKAAMVGMNASGTGTIVMQSHLRVVLAQLGVDVLAAPGMYLMTERVLDDDGNLNESARPVFEKFWDAYVRFIGA